MAALPRHTREGGTQAGVLLLPTRWETKLGAPLVSESGTGTTGSADSLQNLATLTQPELRGLKQRVCACGMCAQKGHMWIGRCWDSVQGLSDHGRGKGHQC